MRLVAVADPNETNGAGALEAAGWSPDQWERTDSSHTAASITSTGRAALVPDFEALDAILAKDTATLSTEESLTSDTVHHTPTEIEK